MYKKLIFTLILFNSLLSFSQKTKTITEFRKEIDTVIKVRKSYFNKNGRLLKEVRFGGYDPISKTFRNRIKKITYSNGRKILEINCEHFINSDTCVTLPYSKYIYDVKNNLEKRIFYDTDSLIISITETKNFEKERYITIYGWDFDPVKEPNYKTAFILKDTVYLNRKGQILKRLGYKKNRKEPITAEKYIYNENGYTLYKEIYGRKSTIEVKYSKLQNWALKQNLEYDFSNDKNYFYEFENY